MNIMKTTNKITETLSKGQIIETARQLNAARIDKPGTPARSWWQGDTWGRADVKKHTEWIRATFG